MKKRLNEELDKAASHPQLHGVHEYNDDEKHAHRDGYLCNRKKENSISTYFTGRPEQANRFVYFLVCFSPFLS